jgi:hypothetical protein
LSTVCHFGRSRFASGPEDATVIEAVREAASVVSSWDMQTLQKARKRLRTDRNSAFLAQSSNDTRQGEFLGFFGITTTRRFHMLNLGLESQKAKTQKSTLNMPSTFPCLS